MGSSTRKKKEKAKDFQKPKLKVGKVKAKPSNFTDTSFKAKSISMGHQKLSDSAPELGVQFKQSLSLACTSRSEKQRREALSNLTSQVAAGTNPVGTPTLLAKLLPLISDPSGPVRSQLIKLFRALPPSELRGHAERCALYVRAGMTHLAPDIGDDALSVLEWLLEVAAEEVVSCPGGWVKTLNSFCALTGWSSVPARSGWSAAFKGVGGGGGGSGMKAKDGKSRERQLAVLARFLEAGIGPEAGASAASWDPEAYWDSLYRVPREPQAFSYLNLFGARRDEEAEMYGDRESRRRVFHRRFEASFARGIDMAKKEGGTAGRSASALDKVLKDGMAGFEPTNAVDPQDLLDLW